MKSSIRAALAVGALALASSQASASSIDVYSGMTPEILNTINSVNPPISADPAYFELKAVNDIAALFKLIDTDPDNHVVTYKLYNDDNGAVASYVIGSLVDSWFFTDPVGGAHYANLLGAQQYYVLEISTNSAYSSSTELSAVPLPAAAWLFGSALLGFGALRRKQKAANSEMAVA